MEGFMKAFLLAAGYGTRLRPLTDNIPKCLVPINGKPLLNWWLDLFQHYGIQDVLINTHYLQEKVHAFIKEYNNRHTGVVIKEAYEPELLGSGGTVLANRDFIGEDRDFLICYADNLTNVNLEHLIQEHINSKNLLSMALFRSTNPCACGIADLDEYNTIIDFVEKPEHPQSNLANAGIYVANYKLFDYINSESFVDLGKDVLPKLINKMHGIEIKDYLLDIGTPESYKKAQLDWKKIKH
jgi:mannose-1-phosphate guanylyltransferase